MRLTERKVCYPRCDKQGKLTKVDYIEIKNKKLAEEKLCQLEDIEEELGIELTTLFGMLKNGFYIKDETGILFIQNVEQWEKLKQYSDFTSQYGKTWALTKEELEK